MTKKKEKDTGSTSADDKVQKFLDKVKKLLKRCVEADEHNRKEAIDCLRMLNGDNHWDDDEIKRRKLEGRPCLKVPLFPVFVNQVVGEMLHNRARAKVKPGDHKSSQHIAKIRSGIISNTEYRSNGEDIYMTAGKSQVACGYGAWRILTRYTDENPFVQEMYLEAIQNPFNVYIDPLRKDEAGADAKYGFVLTKYSRDEFESEWPDAEWPSDLIKSGLGLKDELYYDRDSIVVAEYYVVKSKKVMMCLMEDGTVITKEEADALIAEHADNEQVGLSGGAVAPSPGDAAPLPVQLPVAPAASAGMPPQPVAPAAPAGMPPQLPALVTPPGPPTIVKERPTYVKSVKHYTVTANAILGIPKSKDMSDKDHVEKMLDGEDVPGEYVPIIQVLGITQNIEGKTYNKGLIRDARDAQKMVNYSECLALDTPLPTPKGWTTMGEIQPGDKLFDDKGKICKVIGISDINTGRDCFKITFDDDSTIVTDSTHLWKVEERYKDRCDKWNIKILNTGDLYKDHTRYRLFLPESLKLPEKQLPIHPYTLGVWLGDGDKNSGRITSGVEDVDELRRNLEAVGELLSPIMYDKRTYKVCSFTIYGLKVKTKTLGIHKNKHVPKKYLRASHEQRSALLQGLMDTDGSISKINQCGFSNISNKIAEGFTELLRTLGIKAVSAFGYCFDKNGNSHNNGQPIHKFLFTCPNPDELNVFRLSRKLDRQLSKTEFHPRRTKRYRIRSVEPVESVPTKCVKVSSESSLFLAGKTMIPTHNTALAEHIGLSPKAPFMLTPRQVEGFEDDYKNANVKNNPFLLYNMDVESGVPAPVPTRLQPGAPPVALFNQVTRAVDNLKRIIGIFGGDIGEGGPERTGAAVVAKQKPSDIGSYVYAYKLNRAIELSAKIMNSMIPALYDTERDVRIRNIDDTETVVPINTTVRKAIEKLQRFPQTYKGMNPAKLVEMYQRGDDAAALNDITEGKYEVVVTVGPSYATARQEASQQMLSLINSVPQIGKIGGDLIVEGIMDNQQGEKLASRIRKILPPGLAPLHEGEKPFQPPPPPQLILMQEKAKTEGIKQQKGVIEQKLALVKLYKEMAESKDETDKEMRKQILTVLAELHAPQHPADQPLLEA